MKTATISMALWLAMSAIAVAQTGGYPASPSHGVVGTAPDGAPRYGHEPGKEADKPSETVGRSGSERGGDQGQPGIPPRAGDGSEGKADAAGAPQR